MDLAAAEKHRARFAKTVTKAPQQPEAPADEAEADGGRKPDGGSRTPIPLGPVSKAVVDVIEMNEYVVDIEQDGEAYRTTAKHTDGTEHTAEGIDLFRAICDLAEDVGIDLKDG